VRVIFHMPLDQGKLQQNSSKSHDSCFLELEEDFEELFCGYNYLITRECNNNERIHKVFLLRSYLTFHCLLMNYGLDFKEFGGPKVCEDSLSVSSRK